MIPMGKCAAAQTGSISVKYKMLRFGIHFYLLISRALVIARAFIDGEVLEHLKTSPTTRVIVEFEDTKEHRALRINKSPKGLSDVDYETFVKNLQRAAAGVQDSALRHIAKSRIAGNEASVEYRAFTLWSRNELSIENADRRLVEALAEMPKVRTIRLDFLIPAPRPIPKVGSPRAVGITNENWHVKMIRADEVWKRGVNGHGVVVGIIDSGAHLAHELLATKWRKNYGWYDTVDGTEFPRDESWSGHGTTVTSVIVAGKQYLDHLEIGVAPGATFMMCRTNKNGSHTYGNVVRCIDFMACPTDWRGQNQNCGMRPRIVNHSFGTKLASNWPDQFSVYAQARMTLVVAAGNHGENCGSLSTDSENHWPITVGAVDENRDRGLFSSTGPTHYEDGRIKPDVIAPGVAVYTCSNSLYSHDPSFGFFDLSSGTCISAAIVSGLAALILSANQALEPEEIKKIIQQTAAWNVKRQIVLCGNLSRDTRPNHVVGWGIVNAYKAYQAALKVPCKVSSVYRAVS